MQMYWNKRKFLHKKRVQLAQDLLGTPTGRRFIVLDTNMAVVTSCDNTLYERMGILLVDVHERLGKSVISARKIDCEQSIIFPCKVTARETQSRERRRLEAR